MNKLQKVVQIFRYIHLKKQKKKQLKHKLMKEKIKNVKLIIVIDFFTKRKLMI